MIWRATTDDIPHIFDLSVTFNEMYFDLPIDRVRALRWIEHNIENGVSFVSEKGYIGGILVPDPVRNRECLVEMAWYSTGRDGLALLNAFIEYGREVGADEVRMTTLNTTPDAAVKLLRRKGFEELETSHRLIL